MGKKNALKIKKQVRKLPQLAEFETGPGYMKQHLSLKSGALWNFTRHLHGQRKWQIEQRSIYTFKYTAR